MTCAAGSRQLYRVTPDPASGSRRKARTDGDAGLLGAELGG
jgi:hypothetical protein